ncbi:hypothetical protein DFA_03398 [Cavenderia fasciculata]|uniref:Trafficking protein particle complex subunit 8 n=1 Tax=Cavenderia fasciculata TaxID=261658 RepID=F4PHG6_CACFS|nr:uncharacterized protein DFA_03398 [Cavenderia fasciculata]EGG25150.1 hypothetical protein DFA_03398 [Cavenderia fasciculata]|eukprot:XP_004363001.1 hypothetical protein DFA_03398 [Cavenderia fasciculata]
MSQLLQQQQQNQHKDIRTSIQSWATPSVLVITSPTVQKQFKRMSHSLIDILTQYLEKKKGNRKRRETVSDDIKSINISIDTLFLLLLLLASIKVGESYYELNDFKVNFITLQQLEQTSYDTILKDVAASVDSLATDEYCSNVDIKSKQDVPYFNKVCQDPTPWFERYRHQYLKSLKCNEVETFAHPIACLLIASVEDPNPIGMLVKMFEPSKPPSIISQFNIDPNIPKIHILAHSENTESEKRLSEMKNTFGANNSYLLRVNQKEDDGGLSFDPTANLASNPLNTIINDLITKHIPPYIEKSISELNENITANKKSFFSKMKVSLRIGYKKNEKEGDDKESSTSTSIPVETCLRRLSDLYFLLQDYETALSFYRNLSKELNSDKSPNHYAASFEMIGICNFMLNKETDAQFETALNGYQRGNLNVCAVRTTFIQGEILKRKSNFKMLADLYKTMAERENLDAFCAAILLEQAGFCLLQGQSPSFRKACMRIVLAGDKYAESSKRKHALRCFRFSYSVYEGRDWMGIDDHLHLSLVRYSFFQGHTSDALRFINKLLEKNSQSFQSQNSIIREFLYISKSYTKDNYIGELPIPVIANDRITVLLSDYTSDAHQQVWWSDMEEAFKKEASIITKPVLQGFDLWKRDLFIEVEKEKTIVVEEPITVDVEIRNPLQIPLQFNSVHLVATYKSPDGIEESNMSPLDQVQLQRMENGELPFKVETIDILLGPSETKKLKFSIIPLKQGLLNIRGIGLCMCGTIWGKREFKLKQKRLNKTKTQRESISYEQNLSLTFSVTSPMPRLEAQFVDFPSSICFGEMKQAKLLLKNCSNKMGLKNVRIRISHPTLVCFGSNNQDACILNSLNSSIQLNSIELTAGATVMVPIWVRGGLSVGKYTLRCLVYYESESGNTDLKYRLARCQTDFEVRPSLRISTFSQQSSTDLDAYLLGLEVDNPIIGGGGDVFFLKQISSISKYWKIEPLSYHTDVPNSVILTLHPGQFTNLFFRITPSIKPTAALNEEKGGDQTVTNISFDKNEPMYDSSSFPVYQFLDYEKLAVADQLHHQQLQLQQQANKPNTISNNLGTGNEHHNQLDLMLFWESNSTSKLGTVSSSNSQHQPTRMGVLNSTSISFLPVHYNDPLLATPWGSWKNTTSPTGKTSTLHIDPALKFQAPIRYQILTPDSTIKHNFAKLSICTMPLKLQLSNCSTHQTLQLIVDTLLPHENLDAQSQSTSQYFWTGITKHSVQLSPLENIELPLNICFLQPGTFNINRFKINIKINNGDVSKDIYTTVQNLINVLADDQ